MNLQKIKPANGKHEYVLFVLEDYVDNPVALARMKAHLTLMAPSATRRR